MFFLGHDPVTGLTIWLEPTKQLGTSFIETSKTDEFFVKKIGCLK
jgi:hypothetical protein